MCANVPLSRCPVVPFVVFHDLFDDICSEIADQSTRVHEGLVRHTTYWLYACGS